MSHLKNDLPTTDLIVLLYLAGYRGGRGTLGRAHLGSGARPGALLSHQSSVTHLWVQRRASAGESPTSHTSGGCARPWF